MQKAKHRTKAAYAPSAAQNGRGSHLSSWMPGDPPELHPLFSSFGAFKDDPFWDEFVQAMDDERRKIDERYPVEDDEAESKQAESKQAESKQEDERNVRT